MSFEVDIAKFAKKTGQSVETVAKKTIFKLNELVVLRTPVDTGRARGGWVASIYTGSSSQGAEDKLGSSTIKSANETAEKSLGSLYFLTNNVVYISVLEYGRYPIGPKTTDKGFSQQAPQGMVRLSMQEIKNAFSSFVARERNSGR